METELLFGVIGVQTMEKRLLGHASHVASPFTCSAAAAPLFAYSYMRTCGMYVHISSHSQHACAMQSAETRTYIFCWNMYRSKSRQHPQTDRKIPNYALSISAAARYGDILQDSVKITSIRPGDVACWVIRGDVPTC